MALIHWSESRHGSKIAELDEPKKKFVELVNAMEGAEDHQLRPMFLRLLSHLELWLEREDRFMEEWGVPHREHHHEEHAQLINEVRYLLQRIENGLYSLGHTYIKARLPEWFQAHADDMDAELHSYVSANVSAA